MAKAKSADDRLQYCMDGYISLAGAIVRQACEDYAEAIKLVERNRERESRGAVANLFKAKNTIDSCEMFFRSAWFETLVSSDIDGESLMHSVRKRALSELAKEAAHGSKKRHG